MIKQLFLGLLFFSTLNYFAQEETIENIINTQVAFPISSPSTSWTIIGGSSNLFGVLESESRPLQYHSALNAISFIHTCSNSYSASPANNAGAIVAHISTNTGNNWDSTCIWSDSNYSGAFPQGGIFNPPGNTNINSAYIVGTGTAKDASGNYNGGWYASKQLGTANYNYTASTLSGAMQLLGNAPVTNSVVGKSDFPSFGFTSTNDGKIRTLGRICKNINLNSPSGIRYRGLSLVKGTFNSGVFNWTADSLMFNNVIHTYDSANANNKYKMAIGNPVMAWNDAGTVGYIITVAVRAASSNSQSMGYQPVVWVTTNNGTSWNIVPSINFASPTFSTILKRLKPTETDSTLIIPQFNTSEGISATVDANNKLHFLSTIVSTRSSIALDSMNTSYVYTMSVNTPTATYKWPHIPGKRPCIYDFMTDGLTWTYKTIDSLSTEAPGGFSGKGGYAENPIAADSTGVKLVSDARLQLSRIPGGQYIFYSWAESDTNFITGSLKYNVNPDIKVKCMSVTGLPSYQLSSSAKINISSIGNNLQVKGKSLMHYMSPLSNYVSYSDPTLIVMCPFTITHNNNAQPPSIPYSPILNNSHFYYSATMQFSLPQGDPMGIGFKENILGSVSNSYVYPNPASHSAILSIDMKDNAVVNVDVYNTIGQQVKSSKHTAQVGENNLNIDLSNLSSGIYLVNVKVGNATSTKKLIVQ
ncbi:MAG: hypothetical protein JWO32_2464 [Bacteroidetes bacterium]|nr:hypothetical protein [Bacteroidota bacterium]